MHPSEHHPAPAASPAQEPMHKNPYRSLLVMIILSFISMYILMYAMVNTPGNVLNNLNEVYMAALMTAPMVVIELTVMSMMYPDKRRNAILIGASVLAAILFFTFIQQQTAVGDRQFLRSMIPHHAGAITMCESASLTDPEIIQLCDAIIANQQSEINQMKLLLENLEK